MEEFMFLFLVLHLASYGVLSNPILTHLFIHNNSVVLLTSIYGHGYREYGEYDEEKTWYFLSAYSLVRKESRHKMIWYTVVLQCPWEVGSRTTTNIKIHATQFLYIKWNSVCV